MKKIDHSNCFTDTKDIAAKIENIRYDGYKKIKGVKLSFLVNLNGLPLSLNIVPVNHHDSTLYIHTLKNFKIKKHIGRTVDRASKISTDTAYDATEIRKYNEKGK